MPPPPQRPATPPSPSRRARAEARRLLLLPPRGSPRRGHPAALRVAADAPRWRVLGLTLALASGVFKRSAEKLSALVLAAKPGTVIAVNADKARCGPSEAAPLVAALPRR